MLVNRSHLTAFSQMGQMLRLFYFISYRTTHTNTHTCLVRNKTILNEKRWGKHSGVCIANVCTMALQCVCAYRCMFANLFVFKLFPYLWVHLVVDLLVQSHTGRFPPPGEVGGSRQQKKIFLGGEGREDISRCWGMGKYGGSSLAENTYCGDETA